MIFGVFPRFYKEISHFVIFNLGMDENVILKTMYRRLTEKIERMSIILHFGLVNLSFGVVIIPPLLITLANYFLYNLNDDSFYLLYPYTCVTYFKLI